MSLVLKDRVRETTTVLGTNDATLLGAVTGFQAFSVVGNGNTCYYTIADQSGGNWEVGIGTYSSVGPTLARTTILASSNSNNIVSFPAGTKDVFLTYPSEKAVFLDANGNLNIEDDGELRLHDTSGTEYVALKSPATLAASYTLTMPADDGTNGQALITDGSGNLSWSTAASGDVYGPASATSTAVALFDGTTGKLLKNSGVTIDGSNNVSGVAQLNATTVDLTNLEVTNIKAKDGTQAIAIADTTGALTLSSGTANGVAYLNGSKVLTTGSGLTFNGTTLTATAFSGPLTGNVTGNVSGTAANVTGTVAVANGGTGATTAPQALINLGGTTVGINFFDLTNPSAITFPRINADNTVSALDAATFRTAIGAGTGSGTVTSVTGTSPVASSGGTTPAISLSANYGDTLNPYASKTANYFLAAPNGTAGAPTFRAIVAADIPTLNQNTTGSAATLTTTRTLWGQNFNGSANVTGALSSVSTLSMSGQLTNTVATGTAPFVVSSTTQVANLNAATAGTATNQSGGTVSATSISDSGNLTFTGTGNRITGDFSNATLSNRVAFQTSTANSATGVLILPSGTSTNSSIQTYNNSDPTNSSAAVFGVVGSTDVRIQSAIQGTGTYLPMTFYTSNTERMRIDSSGNVGIGTSSPSYKLDVTTTSGIRVLTSADLSSGGAAYIRFGGSNNAAAGYVGFGGAANTFDIVNTLSGPLTFNISNTERMRIDSSGNWMLGKTTVSIATVGVSALANGRVMVGNAASTGADDGFQIYSTGASAYRFFVGMDGVVHATNATIAAISDQRYKENVRDLDVGLDAILALKPRKFDWKEGKGKDIKNDRGFIAQEFEHVFPDLIDEWKDPAPEGEEPYKSVRQDLIPVLVKAIQELKAELDATKAEIAELKAVN